jgi:RNA polymerase sigma-70 factor (ECF subfamily)
MWSLGAEATSTGEAAHESEAALVRLAQSSPSAFEPLYLLYRDRILGYCYRRLGDRDDAEDAASAVFVAALRGLSGFRDRGRDDSFRAWLFRIAHNEVAMRHRSRSRHPEQFLTDADEVTDPTVSPEDLAVRADGHRRLAGLMAILPPRERETIELRLADLTTREIAQILGATEQSVRAAQARAVARLRAAMGGEGDARSESGDA